MSQISLVIRTTLGLIASLTLLIQPAAAQTKLLFSIFLPPSYFSQSIMREWASDVEKETENRVKIEFAAGSLAPPPQQLEAVKSSIFDIGVVANQFIKNSAPLMIFSQLPWLSSDAEAASVAYWRTYERLLANKKQYPDVHLLSLYQVNGGDFGSTSETPISSIEDLKKWKLWALPGPAADVLKSLDVSPITSPAVQVSESVSRGVVDGVFGLSAESLVDFKAAPYLKALTVFPRQATSTSFSIFINKAKWASISEKDRATIMALSGETLAARVGRGANKATIEAQSKMKADGVKVVQADASFYAAMQKAAEQQYNAYEAGAKKAGVDGKSVIEAFRKEYEAAAKR